MPQSKPSASETQTATNVEKNAKFFRDAHETYKNDVGSLDTYKNIRQAIEREIRGIDRLMDIGNGGVFDYSTDVVKSIVALDLFFDDFAVSNLPPNVSLKTGSALNIPEPDDSFDGVLIVMLLHHLVGKTVEDSFANVRQALRESFRVLKPGGKLVVMESCVPPWFYLFERAVFPFVTPLIDRFLDHPATIQFPPLKIHEVLAAFDDDATLTKVEMGRWILQYGRKWPSALTPAHPVLFVAHKRSPQK